MALLKIAPLHLIVSLLEVTLKMCWRGNQKEGVEGNTSFPNIVRPEERELRKAFNTIWR